MREHPISRTRAFARRRGGWLQLALSAAIALAVPASAAPAQSAPVFVDDAPGAAEAIESARGHSNAGNLDTAARVLQRLLDTSAERLTAAPEGDALMIPVRQRVHRALREDRSLLRRYREIESAEAERLLERGELKTVERSRFLTPAGYEASLRLAQLHLESARFHAARRRLEALADHPDLDAGAARLAALLARYLPEASDLADRLGERFNEPSAGEPFDSPEIVSARSALDPSPGFTFEGLVPEPIRSRALLDERGEPSGLLGASPFVTRARGARVRIDPARILYPSLAGDLLLLADGAGITAFDRFTLEQRWRHDASAEPDPNNRALGRRAVSAGPVNVAVWGRTAVAAASASASREQFGDGLVHAVDIATGEPRWAVDLVALDDDLQDAVPTGVVRAAGGLVVLPVMRNVRERRLSSGHLVALDIADGSLVWNRVVASAGALPQNIAAQSGSVPLIEGGVIYVAEPLGAIAAIELATGRFLWARTSPASDALLGTARTRWGSRPIIARGALYEIEPITGRALKLDPATGRLLAARPPTDFGNPAYLLEAGDALVAVSESEIRAIPFDRFEDQSVSTTVLATAESGRFEGRPVVAGERVLVPAGEGFALHDPAAPSGPVERIEFGNVGNPVIAPAQLAVIDDRGVSSYLIWDAARAALEDRMRRSPGDAAPAVTLAELAYRAGRDEAIVPAIDAALSALRRQNRADQQDAARERLFAAIDQMIEPDPSQTERRALAVATREKLVARLGQAASTPDERALYHLREGALALETGRPDAAVAAYQRVLDEPRLAASQVRLAQRVRLARSVAASRLQSLVQAHGPSIYAVFEREAGIALRRALPPEVAGALDPALGSHLTQVSPEELVAIARRYPVAVASLEAWLVAAEAFQQRGRLRGAIASLEEALAAATELPHAPDPVIAELAGRLATRLVEGGRAAAASSAIARIQQARPALAFTTGGEPVDLAALQERIAEARARTPRRPRLGRIDETALTPIPGRLPIRPLYPATESDHSLVLLAGEDVLEAWERGAVGVERRWSMPLDPSLALLRLDSGGALVSVGDGDLRRLARVDARTGETVWETPPFSAGFDARSRPAPSETVAIPAGPIRPRGEILAALRDDNATLIDRAGRAVGYDVAEGRDIWSAQLPIDNVFDAAEAGGLLIIIGERRFRDVNARAGAEPAGLIVDAATGRVIAPLDFAGAAPRWVRETTDEVAVVGTDRGVIAFNLVDGSRRWFVGEPAAQRTIEAWSFPGRLIILDDANRLWQLETEGGELSRAPLDTRSRLQGPAEDVSVAAAGDHAVFALPRGLVMYDRRGELVGLDQRDGLTSLGPHAFADDRAVVLDPHGFEPRVYDARLLELDTGRLLQAQRIELPARPDSVDLIDGRILISAGSGTIVLDAPPEADPAP